MLDLGAKRFREEVRKAKEKAHLSTTPAGMQVITSGAGRVIKALERLQKSFQKGEPVLYNLELFACLVLLPIDVIAYLALKTCVNLMGEPRMVTKVAIEIGTALEDEYRFRDFKGKAPKLLRAVKKDLDKKTTDYRRQRAVLIHTANKYNLDLAKFPDKFKVKIGAALIDIICSETGLFKTEIKQQGFRKGRRYTPKIFLTTKKTLDWVKKKHSICEFLSPVKMPCIIPPKPWSGVQSGGYYTYPLKLVKSSDRDYLNLIDERIENGDMKEVIQALNTIQETPWRINKRVLEIMNHYHKREIEIPILVPLTDKPLPPFPERKLEEPEDDYKESVKRWKAIATGIHSENVRYKTKRIQHAQLLWIANKFRDCEKFYFPHSLDFRGRAYANSAFLNPQAQDTGRALLEFAVGKQLGPYGAPWLAIHGANCYGKDKLSFEERIEWVEQANEDILEYHKDPLTNTGWMQADKPWQFLAFCFEWASYRKYGTESISYLPVNVDGSCNGIQHFSALLRDHIGAKSVNLLPSDEPNDIYEIVAGKARELNEDPEWDGKITRSLVKRPVMTTPYGVTEYGIRDQIYDEIVKQIEKGVDFGFKDPHDISKYAKSLSSTIWKAIGETLVASRQAMEWLQNCMREVLKQNDHIYWSVPSGFLVKQAYYKTVSKRVTTVLNGKIAELRYAAKTPEPDKRKSINAIAPNYVHSLDSSHMMKTVNYARDKQSIGHFSVVHDSFGTHACNVEYLVGALKETFIETYQNNLLENFKREVEGQVEDLSLPEIPNQGELDINDIREADFFFS